jgi:predicted metal-dependent hydrolase
MARTAPAERPPVPVRVVVHRTIQASPTLLDYVVVHELVHIEHPNHTRHFWAALGRAMPDYDARRARLRAIGPELEW